MSILYYCEDDTDQAILQALKNRLPKKNIEAWPNCQDKTAITTAVVWQPPPEFFDGLASLRHVLSIAAGVDHLLEHPGLPSQVDIVRLTDAGMAEPMSDFVLYGVLHAQRRMHELAKAQRQSQWRHEVRPLSKSSFNIGILGAGVFGTAAARRLAMNGFQVTCWSRSEKQIDGINHVCGPGGLNELVSNANVLVCLLPLTSSTHHIIDAKLLAKLPTHAFVINPGRGGHIDEPALLDALDSDHLSGALLDVFDVEPLPAQHKFWQHEKVIVTPHVAGPTDKDAAIEQIAASVELLEQGRVPSGLVDRKNGY